MEVILPTIFYLYINVNFKLKQRNQFFKRFFFKYRYFFITCDILIGNYNKTKYHIFNQIKCVRILNRTYFIQGDFTR